MPPKLLVSVRTPQEALIAARASVQIIDMKEPKSGSLGMLKISDIAECVKTIKTVNQISHCSAACGEVVDWLESNVTTDFRLPSLNYLKIGLSRLAKDGAWREKWSQARHKIESYLKEPASTNWIAVAYVDAEAAQSPTISEVIAAAAECGCRGVLFDTYEKNSLRFSDWVTDSELINYLKTIHSAGMFCSVAGKLNEDDIIRLSTLPVDVLAVRSAVCVRKDRTAEISKDKILHLQSLIN